METGKLELTQNEAQVLLNCINITLKQEWSPFAESAVHLNKLLQSAFPVEEKVAEEVKENEDKSE